MCIAYITCIYSYHISTVDLASIRVNKTVFSSFLKHGERTVAAAQFHFQLRGSNNAACTKYVTHADSKIWIHIPTLHLVQFRLFSEFFKMFAILAWTSRKSCLTVRWWLPPADCHWLFSDFFEILCHFCHREKVVWWKSGNVSFFYQILHTLCLSC